MLEGREERVALVVALDAGEFEPVGEHLLGTEFELRHREPRDGFRFETWVRR
jgi:hypothetical protein